jgi:ribonucleotide reductase alpha subunit
MAELVKLGAWNEEVKQSIIKNKGSVQHLSIPGFDEHSKNKYRTVWEIPMKHLIDMSVDRAPFVCQSQSLNLWVEDPNYNVLTSMHFYAWKKGLKTGIYYLRRKAKHQAQQFTVAVASSASDNNNNNNASSIVECELCSA